MRAVLTEFDHRPGLCLILAMLLCPGSRVSAAELPFPVPLGLPSVPWPQDNPYTPEKAELGRLLFFDDRLSKNGLVSCASCHDPAHAFSGVTSLSSGVTGRPTGRHSPTLINRAYGKSQFWDGRAPTIESQVVIPLTHPDEMGMTVDKAVAVIAGIAGYRPLFSAAFGDDSVNFDRITKSIATFERTILSGNSRFDHYAAGDKNALTKEEKDGLEFFNGKGECAECHNEANFTNEKFENLGIGMDRRPLDPGREIVTHKRGDLESLRRQLFETSHSAVRTCMTAASRLLMRCWIFTQEAAFRILMSTSACCLFIWIPEPGRLCLLS